jgi:hypothetical protein
MTSPNTRMQVTAVADKPHAEHAARRPAGTTDAGAADAHPVIRSNELEQK